MTNSTLLTDFTFLSAIQSLPQAGDRIRAANGLERWRAAGTKAGDDFAAALAADPVGAALLGAIFGNSPFLTRCVLGDAGFFHRIVTEGPDSCLDALLAELGDADADADTVGLKRRLRVARRRVALAVGVADIAGVWPLDRVTGALTRFAEAALELAVAHLLRASAAAGEIRLADPANPQAGSGLVVLGLGKLGAGELNYSSDIDLMVLYDPSVVDYSGRDGPQACFVRLTRNLVRLLEERASDGHVFRTDLRLRPDPGSTPLALSVEAAETYYETVGQNWERAAMIKARPVAGDLALGDAFLSALAPFIWRKHLDFAALRDIHSIKRQIHAHHGGAKIAVNGHNIKLGRGGIREIEFFVQTQQLIWGGRDPTLRPRATCDALRALAAAGRIEQSAAEELAAAYRYLRRVEHRLQMIDDAQTHTVPRNADGVAALAVFLGYADGDAFAAALIERLGLVERRYAELFEEAPPLAPTGSLVFTGVEDDPDTLTTLRELGFRDGAAVGAMVRSWHHGRFRAMRSTRARELLTELMPALLGAFANTANPDAALLRFNEFLSRLPTGVQLFSLFHANPGLLDLVAEVMGSAPRLADRLSRNPELLDGVLSADFYGPPPDAETLAADLDRAIGQARDYEDVLDITRRRAHDREFQAGVQMLIDPRHADRAGVAFSDIADSVLRALEPRVEEVFAAAHGRIPGAGFAILAMGNLGGREMTVASDLDLIFIYDSAAEGQVSDGAKALPTSQYFVRLGQRFMNAVTALTNEGRLYEIDMRLRPSGKSGPLASEIGSFIRYQHENAWTWEHMALTRARVITGPAALAGRLTEAIRDVLASPRDAARLVADVADMRARIDAEHHTDNPWQTKHVRGGLVDLEFIAEYLQLRHAAARPDVLSPNTLEAFRRLAAAGLLPADDAELLVEATRMMRRVQGMVRLTIGGARVEEEAPEGLRAILAQCAGTAGFAELKDKLLATQARVHDVFAQLIGEPGGASPQ